MLFRVNNDVEMNLEDISLQNQSATDMNVKDSRLDSGLELVSEIHMLLDVEMWDHQKVEQTKGVIGNLKSYIEEMQTLQWSKEK